MPRLNDCLLTGFVGETPSIKQNKDGEIVQAAVNLIVCTGKRSYVESYLSGDRDRRDVSGLHYDSIWISTKDPVFIRKINKLRVFDIVQCKGVLRVSQVRKRCTCPECGEPKRFLATKTAVYPIYLERLRSLVAEHGITGEITQTEDNLLFAEAKAFLKDAVEISNNISVIGAVATQPALYQDLDKKNIMLSFPIAVMRSYYIAEDDMSTKVDFPYVKIYGEDAMQASDMLSRGNLVLCRGHLATRRIFRKIPCDECGLKFAMEDYVTEIIPRSIEFIRVNVCDAPPLVRKGPAYAANYIGSEADIDLKKPGMETDAETVASGVTVDSDVQEIADAVLHMEDGGILGE